MTVVIESSFYIHTVGCGGNTAVLNDHVTFIIEVGEILLQRFSSVSSLIHCFSVSLLTSVMMLPELRGEKNKT